MTILAILLLSLSMSADAFAAALARGAAHRPSLPGALRAGLVFGVIEAITPVLGWLAGRAAAGHFEDAGPWIAFVLLLAVGAHMLRQSRRDDDAEATAEPPRGNLLLLVATAIGTSIDAAAVGVGLAFIDVSIWTVAASIGVSTFLLASSGLFIGARIGAALGKTAEMLGGIILIVIGSAILVQHQGWI